MRLLPAPVLGLVTLTCIMINTLFWSFFLFGIVFLKAIIPESRWRLFCSRVAVGIAGLWVDGNGLILRLTQRIDWDVRGLEGLKRSKWYLIVCNHRSWADILVLQKVLNKKIPFLRFFLKQQLIWVPVLGLAWWVLDFPFMKRYSRELLEKKPHLKTKDMETTRSACNKFRHMPVSLINFLEGTRFTPSKRDRQSSPYQHLLLPKAGGIAYALEAMGGCLAEILDVTIVYPRSDISFWDLLSGRLGRIVVRVERMPVPEDVLGKDYQVDAEFRRRFRAWVNQLWLKKDAMIGQMTASFSGGQDGAQE